MNDDRGLSPLRHLIGMASLPCCPGFPARKCGARLAVREDGRLPFLFRPECGPHLLRSKNVCSLLADTRPE